MPTDIKTLIGAGFPPFWVRKTTTYTAVNGDRVIADTSGGAWTLTLPASPSVGYYVQITDGANFATYNLTVARNGSTIEGASDDVLLDIPGTTFEFIYDGTTWEITATTGKKGDTGPTGPAGPTGSGAIGSMSGIFFASSSGVATTNSNLLYNSGINAVHVNGTVKTQDLDVSGRYTELYRTASISSNTLSLNMASGHIFTCPLNANINTFTITNVPSGVSSSVTVLFTADGTLRTVTWPTTTLWPGGTSPTMTSTNGKVDIFSLLTVNSGVTWYGFVGGQNF